VSRCRSAAEIETETSFGRAEKPDDVWIYPINWFKCNVFISFKLRTIIYDRNCRFLLSEIQSKIYYFQTSLYQNLSHQQSPLLYED